MEAETKAPEPKRPEPKKTEPRPEPPPAPKPEGRPEAIPEPFRSSRERWLWWCAWMTFALSVINMVVLLSNAAHLAAIRSMLRRLPW